MCFLLHIEIKYIYITFFKAIYVYIAMQIADTNELWIRMSMDRQLKPNEMNTWYRYKQ